MKHYIQTTLNPSGYHGHHKKPPFFEGWYFKLVNADQSESFAIIPGIFKGKTAEQTHAFIQVLDGRRQEMEYVRFPAGAFQANATQLNTTISDNHFTTDSITLNLPNLRGKLQFHNIVPWPVTLTAPGIMGWYAWIPIMECYHGLVSLDHTISGQFQLADRMVDFAGGRGYTEKDWGRNFPATWIWLQANHFNDEGTCLTASIARIPWFGRSFPGFIIGLWHEGTLYRFTTYVRAKLEKVQVTDTTVHITVRNRTHRLTITAQRAPGALLRAPTPNGMTNHITETIGASAHIHFATLSGKTLYEGSSDSAGLEVEGNISLITP